MIISLIVAYDRKRGIGRGGMLPWHVSADLQLFKRLTWGHHLIVGHRTFRSIGGALPGRTLLVLSTKQQVQLPQACYYASSLQEALAVARQNNESECFVIGGAEVYRHALPLVERMYISQIDGEFECDVFFPPFDETQWVERFVANLPPSGKSAVGVRFRVLDRNGKTLPLDLEALRESITQISNRIVA